MKADLSSGQILCADELLTNITNLVERYRAG